MPAAALSDKVAIIIGAASGIGAATAERFIAEGAQLMLADIDGDAAEAAAERLGHIDILYNNAGVLSRGALDAIDGDDLRAVLDANLVGPALTSRARLPALRESARLGLASTLAGAVGPSIDQVAAGIPIGRLIRVEEVASAALFLCSDQASAISDVLPPVDGTITAR
ncbi:MAG TPA: SDR family oxidoreductase [Reyranella sp.]|jgi:NAD(P)-dependent dehydrogenase (short-subunit alcohol dehydrogenase family)